MAATPVVQGQPEQKVNETSSQQIKLGMVVCCVSVITATQKA
jgi:hypothetical protein